MISISISRKRIDKKHLAAAKSGVPGEEYLNGVLHESKKGQDQYGNDGFITQSVSKEAYQRGEKGPIIGNWRWLKKRQQPATPAPTTTTGSDGPMPSDEDVPY